MISQAEPSPIATAVIFALAFTALLVSIAMRMHLFLIRRKTKRLKARLEEMKRQVWEENERRARKAGIELQDKQGLFS